MDGTGFSLAQKVLPVCITWFYTYMESKRVVLIVQTTSGYQRLGSVNETGNGERLICGVQEEALGYYWTVFITTDNNNVHWS